MKRIKIKEWVKYILILINFIYVMLLSGDCENFIIFTISKVILLGAFLFNNYILYKYSDLFE